MSYVIKVMDDESSTPSKELPGEARRRKEWDEALHRRFKSDAAEMAFFKKLRARHAEEEWKEAEAARRGDFGVADESRTYTFRSINDLTKSGREIEGLTLEAATRRADNEAARSRKFMRYEVQQDQKPYAIVHKTQGEG